MSDDARHFLGFVESTVGQRVSGWCIRPDAPMEQVELVLLLRGIPAARGLTEMMRPDVAADQGCHPACGFAFVLDVQARDADIQVLPLGADAPLPRLPSAPPRAPVAPVAPPIDIVLELDEAGWIRAEPFPFD